MRQHRSPAASTTRLMSAVVAVALALAALGSSNAATAQPPAAAQAPVALATRVLTPGERLAIYPPRSVSKRQMNAIMQALEGMASRILSTNGTVTLTEQGTGKGLIKIRGDRLQISMQEGSQRLEIFMDRKTQDVRVPVSMLLAQGDLTLSKWNAALRKAGIKPTKYISLGEALDTKELFSQIQQGPIAGIKPTRWSWRQTRTYTEWTVSGVHDGKRGTLTMRCDRQGNSTYVTSRGPDGKLMTVTAKKGNPVFPAGAFTSPSLNIAQVMFILLGEGIDFGGGNTSGSSLLQLR